MLVDKHEQYLRTSNRTVENEELHSALQELTCRTVGSLCQNLRVYAVRAPGFNAFMMPNGAMFVQSGLLLRVSDDAELAAVPGHEASHFTRRHSLHSMRRWHRTSSGFAIVGALASAAVSALERGAESESGMPAEAYREWAKVNVREGDKAKARQNFQKFLELDPDAWDAKHIGEPWKATGGLGFRNPRSQPLRALHQFPTPTSGLSAASWQAELRCCTVKPVDWVAS